MSNSGIIEMRQKEILRLYEQGYSKRKISKQILDHIGSTELAAKLFCATQTE